MGDYGLSKLSKHNDEYANVLKQNFHHFVKLQEMLAPTKEWLGCGSYLFDGRDLSYHEGMHPKQLLLYNLAKEAKEAMEIGVHVGHSLLIMLIANPNLKILANDICWWAHTEKCVAYLNEHFGNRIEFVKDSSLDFLERLKPSNWDLIHIDGDHRAEYVQKELRLLKHLAKSGTNVVFDDYDCVSGIMDNSIVTIVNIPDCPWRNCLTKLK